MEMTREWIDQFNKKCAEFMGYLNTTPTDPDFDIYEKKGGEVGNLIEPKSCKFHSDWNWIMEVVDKIESFIFQEPVPDTYYEVRVVGSVYVYIGSNNGDELINVDDQPSKKQAVVKAIDQFIDWYNENKLKIEKDEDNC